MSQIDLDLSDKLSNQKVEELFVLVFDEYLSNPQIDKLKDATLFFPVTKTGEAVLAVLYLTSRFIQDLELDFGYFQFMRE